MMFYVGKKESAVVLLKLYQLCRAMPHAYVNITGEGVCAVLLFPLPEALCCLLPQLLPAYLVEPASEHLLLEMVHTVACIWLCDPQLFIWIRTLVE